MQQTLRVLGGFGIAALIVCGPLFYANYRHAQVRNFHVVVDGVLYRSGQMNLTGLKKTVHDYGIRTLVTLRDSADPKDPPPDHFEEEYCHEAGILHVRIAPRDWWSKNGFAPADRGVKRFREIMDNPANYPVLIHCFAGIHRTGAFCAVYRMEFQDWTNAEAIAELRAAGYNNIEDEWDVLSYLEGYVPRYLRAQGERHDDAEAAEPAPVHHTVKRIRIRKKAPR